MGQDIFSREKSRDGLYSIDKKLSLMDLFRLDISNAV